MDDRRLRHFVEILQTPRGVERDLQPRSPVERLGASGPACEYFQTGLGLTQVG